MSPPSELKRISDFYVVHIILTSDNSHDPNKIFSLSKTKKVLSIKNSRFLFVYLIIDDNSVHVST